MEPLEVLTWVGVIALSAVVLAVASLIVVSAVRSIRNPVVRTKRTSLLTGKEDR